MKRVERKLALIMVMVGLVALASWQFSVRGSAQSKTGQDPAVAGVTDQQDGAQAAAQEAKRRAHLEHNLDGLAAKARAKGTVRVVVYPRGDFKFSREMDEDQVQARRGRVAAARDSLEVHMRQFARGSVKTYSHAQLVAFDVDESGLEALKSDPEIEMVEEDIVFTPSLSESTPLIGATHAWSSGFTGKGQVIAIADTGVDRFHPFLLNKVVKELCFSTTGGTASSLCPNGMTEQEDGGAAAPCNLADCFHGTHVAGIAAGKGASFSGVAKEAKIIAIQIFHKEADPLKCKNFAAPCIHAFNSDIQAAALWLNSHTNDFEIASMNLSVGSGTYVSPCDSFNQNEISLYSLGLVLSATKDFGIAVVAASGNDGYKVAMSAPACLSSVVSVGASSKADAVPFFSNSASFLDLLAPGVTIYSSVPGGGYAYYDGTSMASPHVAGAFAVLKSKAPAADVDTLLSILKTTGKPLVDPFNGIKKPRIDLGAAIDSLCTATLSPGSATFYNDGGTGQFSVTEGTYCNSWKPKTASPWIQVTSPSQLVTGNGTVQFKVSAWPWSAGGVQTQRTGYITVGGKNFKVTQIRVD